MPAPDATIAPTLYQPPGLRLNLGSGPRPQPDFVNIDREAAAAPDLLHDLEQTPYPFEDESVGVIRAHHVLEHLGADTAVYLGIWQEFYRILAPRGLVDLRFPHHRHDNFFNDPTHVRVITAESLALFSRKNCEEFRARGWPNTPLALYLGIDFDIIKVDYTLTPAYATRYASGQISKEELHVDATLYNNVIDEVAVYLRKVTPTG